MIKEELSLGGIRFNGMVWFSGVMIVSDANSCEIIIPETGERRAFWQLPEGAEVQSLHVCFAITEAEEYRACLIAHCYNTQHEFYVWDLEEGVSRGVLDIPCLHFPETYQVCACQSEGGLWLLLSWADVYQPEITGVNFALLMLKGQTLHVVQQKPPTHPHKQHWAVLSGDGGKALMASGNTLKVWELEQQKFTREMPKPYLINDMALYGETLALAGESLALDKCSRVFEGICVLNLTEGTQQKHIPMQTRVKQMQWVLSGKALLWTDEQSGVCLWDITSDRVVTLRPQEDDPLFSVVDMCHHPIQSQVMVLTEYGGLEMYHY